ncbi:MAG: hypothetical protein M3O62_12630 [Pseudomonadota bacterium]|nr:hypothetical protein [Pseudomonadota bacterium]
MEIDIELVKAFIAGFISTLIFHQGVLAALYAADLSPKSPFDMTPTVPFHIPTVISLAFWGGVWGIALWLAIGGVPEPHYWTLAIVLGALGPTFVALFIVFPLKGLPMAGGWSPKIVGGALVLNGAWGVGVALLMLLMAKL